MKFSIQLPTNSITETVNFYKEHLGLTFEIMSPDYFAAYQGTNYQIQFQKTDNKPAIDGICLLFVFDNAVELYNKMKKCFPVNIPEHPKETFNFAITDNNGYQIYISSPAKS